MDYPETVHFEEDVFTDALMKEKLSAGAYEKLHRMEKGASLDPKTAEDVAFAMKEWALQNGATHYTHWFQPLTGATAEKHDAFLSNHRENGKALMSFSGRELMKGEPDASSFPSGGLRATFEARGYTVWDCTSPAFLRRDAAGVILCIPTAFCSYTGEALDQKTPLLRSMQAINEQSLRLLRLFGNTTSKSVTAYVGAEQEYFLVDKQKYLQRKDMVYTGRTLFGAKPPKGQELDDHYFGAIRERIAAYMKDVNETLWKMGVPAKTQHNEVAPAQHELACLYEKCNVATDHNQLVMEVLKKVADRHGLHCLLHEKPFMGVNGSGKHNNWSLMTDDGIQLLDPGKTPHENIQFLLILTCVLRAVDLHADLLRESAADPGNDLRLGGDEAPPAVISVFLGEQLEDVLEQLLNTGEATHCLHGRKIMTDLNATPNLRADATDRNRTSPFAFTGNKFEFRMVGAKDSISEPNVVLNTIVAESFADTCDRLEAAEDFELAVHNLIKEYAAKHGRVVFSGNGYAKDWEEEAKRRGLSALSSMVDAIPALTREETVAMYERMGVFTRAELLSRAAIKYENYTKAMNIEAKSMIDITGRQIYPVVVRYTKTLADTVNAVKAAGGSAAVQTQLLTDCTRLLEETQKALRRLIEADKKGDAMQDTVSAEKEAAYFRDEVVPAMEALRRPIDRLERMVEQKYWPMPAYGDLLFEI